MEFYVETWSAWRDVGSAIQSAAAAPGETRLLEIRFVFARWKVQWITKVESLHENRSADCPCRRHPREHERDGPSFFDATPAFRTSASCTDGEAKNPGPVTPWSVIPQLALYDQPAGRLSVTQQLALYDLKAEKRSP